MVFTIMLAITNHWTCLVALKYNNVTEFWFFDSKNLQFLNFNRSDITHYIKGLNEDRLAEGK
jgi:hypothetical protein